LGDGGNADDPIRAGQDTSTLLGKMLRIDVDTAQAPRAYGIPADNPFVGADDPDDDVLDEIWATGLRNPWRFSIDRATDTMWVGDVGQNRIEEIAIVRAGQNHGWSVFEGNDCFRGDAACNVGGFTAPVVTYAHAQGRVSVTGGFVYRGSALPDLVGTYLFADFGSKEVFALTTNPDGTAGFERKVTMSGGGIASFAEDANGELWLVDLAGPLFRLDPAGPPVVDTFPRLLSETGCVDDADRRQLAPSVVPYGLNHPFYSDGADKHRGVAIPDGTVAAVVESGDDAGQIALPTGSVLVKHFEVDGVPVETRTLVRHDDGEWAGYSYEWGVTDGDAVLVDPAGKTKVLSTGQTWVYPSRAGCLSCHTAAAGRVLGLELQQQNGGFVYPNGRFANQLRTLAHIGYVPAEVDDDLAALPALPPPDLASVDVSARARAYLHVNCSMCHRPGGGGQSQADLRIDRTLTQTNICDRVPEEGDFGVENARVLAPGDPARSLLSVRMKRLAPGRMPLLGSTVVDTTGTDLVDRFITTTSACD
jgi:uncharacterized repeat protein (TIGR03806 family)